MSFIITVVHTSAPVDVMDIEYMYEMIDIIGGAGQSLTLINL